MPGKSHHRKRHLPAQRPRTFTTPSVPATEVPSPRREEALARTALATAPPARSGQAEVAAYPYVGGELRMVGIVTAITLVVLVILTLVLT